MTDDKSVKAGKAAFADATAAAHNLSKDAGVKAKKAPVEVKTGAGKPGPGDATAAHHVNLTCPRCGKSTLRAESPDQYETWMKCSSCGFFMGMNNDEWHRMKNSPNISEKIKKMAGKKGLLKG
jgi:predicted RNA-binding Zn-ribbon protein involved in translation (DUF1610 family)